MASNLPVNFRKATRQQSKASIVIEGLSGTGKTGLALALAYYLSDEDWDKVYATDTENRSMDLYDGLTLHTGQKIEGFSKFDLLQSVGYRPTHYLAGINSAIVCGAKAYINDSLTHAWVGKDGVLQLVSALEAKNAKVNKFSAWGTQEIIEEKNAIYECIRNSELHMINTIRVKEKREMVQGDKGMEIKSLGEQQIMMPDLKYEPDLVIHMVSAGTEYGKCPVGEIMKSRYAVLEVGQRYEFTEALLKQIVAYLNDGADPAVLQEQQRQEYIAAVTELLDSNPSKKTIYPMIKESLGMKDIALTDMTLKQVRSIFVQIIN